MLTVVLGIGFVGLFFVLMSTQILLKKNGEFKGTCSSNNPLLQKEGATCSYCGKTPGSCENSKEGDLEVNPA